MLDMEFKALLLKIQQRQCEEQTVEVKAAHRGCPDVCTIPCHLFPIRMTAA